jgi:PadR family transcriptional regulator PadR
MNDKLVLGSFEFALVSALITLKENAYGMRIRQELDVLLGRSVAIGAVYTTLARLEDKKLISSYVGDPTPARGGRAKRYYRLEIAGQNAFAATIAAQDRLRRTLPLGVVPT